MPKSCWKTDSKALVAELKACNIHLNKGPTFLGFLSQRKGWRKNTARGKIHFKWISAEQPSAHLFLTGFRWNYWENIHRSVYVEPVKYDKISTERVTMDSVVGKQKAPPTPQHLVSTRVPAILPRRCCWRNRDLLWIKRSKLFEISYKQTQDGPSSLSAACNSCLTTQSGLRESFVIWEPTAGKCLFLNNSVFTPQRRHSRGSQQGGCWHTEITQLSSLPKNTLSGP